MAMAGRGNAVGTNTSLHSLPMTLALPRLFRLVAAVAALAGSAFSGPALAQLNERHAGFTVLCRTDLYCTAETPMRTADGLVGRFKLERSGDAGDKLYLTASPARKLVEGMRVDMDVHGTGLDEVTGIYGTVRRIYANNEMAFAQDTTDNVVDWIRRGAVIDVTASHPGAVDVYRASLDGATAALLAFDRAQGRIGRRDAIIAYGSMPFDGDDYSPDIPRLAGSESADARRRSGGPAANQPKISGSMSVIYSSPRIERLVEGLVRPGRCNFSEAVTGVGAWVAEFEGGGGLYTIPCRLADVNFSFVVVEQLSNVDKPKLVSFVTPEGATQTVPVNANFNPDAGTIDTTEYFGPEADCGRQVVYRYRAGGEPLPPIAVRQKSECDGRFSSPWDWRLTSGN